MSSILSALPLRSLVVLTGLCTLASVIGLSVSSTTPAQGATAPSRPTGLTVAQESYSSVSISWDDPQDDSITGYQVLRRSRDGNDYGDGEGSWDFVVIEDDTGSADTEYTDTSVTPRTRYVYRVKARNSAGLSERSSYANAETLGVADNPTGLTVASASHDSITIEWDDPQDDGITGYQVLRRSRDGSDYGDGGGSWDFVVIEDDTGSADTEYTDTSVTPRTRYVYRVKARNPAGLSGRSSYANAETTPAPVVVVEPPVKTEQGDNKGGVHTAMQRSEADVSLSSLTVDGSSVTGVAEGETEFLVRVANATSQVTLAATATDSTSTVYYNNVDADGIAEGHQVDLRVGSNSITIRVVAQDFVTTASYTLTINRADSNVFGWAVLTDIEDVLGYGDSRGGIWSDGTYLWVSGGDYPWLYAYVLATGERQSDRDISLAAVNQDQRGIWSNGATMWVLDNEDRMLYAYNLETGARDEAKDFGVFGDEDKDYYGVWSDGETVWISTANGYTVDAYDFSSGEEKPDLKYNNLEASGQDHNAGIWSDGVRMWVVDPNRKAIFAYDSPHSERNSGWNFQRLIAAGNESPRDIWSDGVTMWVSDSADGKVYSYNMRASDNAELHSMIAAGRALADFEPDTHNYTLGVGSMVSQAAVQAIPRQILATVSYSPEDADPNSSGYQVNLNTGANSVTITVTAQDGMTSEVYTLDINRGSADPFGWKVVEDFDTLNMAGNESPAGLASDGSTMWVADEVDLKLYAYDVETKARVPDLDITLDAEQGSPGGMWTDGTTIWVFDVVDRKLYAYDVNASQRDESKDLDWPEERFPHHFGVWSDGDTLWLSQRTGGLTAYDLGTETRDEHKDYDALDGIDGIDARGIWSDGATMWVVDSTNDKIRALNVFTGEPDTGKEISTLRVADVGGTRGIWSDGETMWVTDWTAAKVYSYNLPLSDSADLRKVVVDGGEATGSTLDGAWYATVDATATQATIEWAAAQMKSTASHDGVDNGAVAEGHQLAITHLAADMAITVTAQNGDTREHKLIVSRVATDSAGRVSVGESTTGDIAGAEEFDVFAVDLVTDELYRFELEGIDNGDGNLAGPKLRGLFKLVQGTAIPVGDAADFAGGQGTNASEVYHEPKPEGQAKATKATYYVVVGGETGASGGYRLSVSYEDEATADASTTAVAEVLLSSMKSGKRGRYHFRGVIGDSGDIDWVKVTLEADQMYRIVVKSAATGNYRTISDPLLLGLYTGDGSENYIRGTLAVPYGNRHEPRLHYYAETAGVYYVSVRGYEDDTGAYDLLVAEVEDDCQPDNISTHDAIAVGESKYAKINYRGDADWFRAELTGGTVYTATASRKESARPLVFPKVLIYDGGGRMVSSGEWDSDENSSVATYTPGGDGAYFIVVKSAVMQWTGGYEVSLSE